MGAAFPDTTQCLRLLPAFPEATPWSGCTVLETLKAMAKGKAPGLDEWKVAEMRDWPGWLHTSTAQLLNKVEEEGVWPVELPGAMGILLPKGGRMTPWTAAQSG